MSWACMNIQKTRTIQPKHTKPTTDRQRILQGSLIWLGLGHLPEYSEHFYSSIDGMARFETIERQIKQILQQDLL